jgi:hypothetical protein
VAEQLQRPQFGMHLFDWTHDNDGIAYWLAHGDWIKLLRASSFEIVNLIEIYPAPDAVTHAYYDYVPAAWAKQWPSEEIWVARKP